MKHLLLFSLIVLGELGSASAEQLAFSAVPWSKVTSSADSTSRELLDAQEKSEFRLLISKAGNDYFWANRENRPLAHVVSGAFHLFIDPQGGGYIKIFDSNFIPKSLRNPGPRYSYVEHVTLGLGSITYWGSSDQFEP